MTMDNYFFDILLRIRKLAIRKFSAYIIPFLLFWCASPVLSSFLVGCKDSSDAYMEKGKTLLREGKTREGIGYLNQAIEKDLDNAEAFNTRGVAYFELKEYPNAMLDYRQAIQIAPKLYRPYFNRALLFTAQNQLDSALADYGRAAQLAPDTADIYLNRGQVYALLDQTPQAIQDFEKATQLDGDNPLAWYNLGNTYYRQQEYAKATLAFNQATRYDPKFGKAFYGLGLSQYEGSEKDLACLSFQQAERLGYAEAAAAIARYCGR